MNVLSRCKPLLGTFVEITIKGELPESSLLSLSQKAFGEIERIHHLLGFHDEKSELSLVNQFLLTPCSNAMAISDDLAKVLKFSLLLNQKTQGVYDITVAPYLVFDGSLPNHLQLRHHDYGNCLDLILNGNDIFSTKPICIDLGGIAKGYAVDCAVNVMPKTLDVTINAGGDIYKRYWQQSKVAIKYGLKPSALKNIKMLNCAIATSGNYHKEGSTNFYNATDGKQVNVAGSVSVFANTTMIADALTKVVALSHPVISRKILNEYQATAVRLNRFGFKKLV